VDLVLGLGSEIKFCGIFCALLPSGYNTALHSAAQIVKRCGGGSLFAILTNTFPLAHSASIGLAVGVWVFDPH
jgi:hypothetical protein